MHELDSQCLCHERTFDGSACFLLSGFKSLALPVSAYLFHRNDGWLQCDPSGELCGSVQLVLIPRSFHGKFVPPKSFSLVDEAKVILGFMLNNLTIEAPKMRLGMGFVFCEDACRLCHESIIVEESPRPSPKRNQLLLQNNATQTPLMQSYKNLLYPHPRPPSPLSSAFLTKEPSTQQH